MIHRLNAEFTRIIANQVSFSPSTTNSRNSPAASTVGCSIWEASTTSRNIVRPGKWCRAV
jgi:hypothetical protein